MKINMLPASYGDCLLIELKKNNNDNFTILIDGGTVESYKKSIKNILEKYLIGNKKIDLVIITHSDNDHISGMNYILENRNFISKIDRVIYNSPYAIGKKIGCCNQQDLKKKIEPKIIKETKVSCGFRKKEIERKEISVTNTSAKKANKLQQILFNIDKLEMDLIVNDGAHDIELDGINIKFLSPTIDELTDFFYLYKDEINKSKKSTINNNTSKNKTDYDTPFKNLMANKETKKISRYNMASLAFIIAEEITGQSILIMGDSSYQLVKKKLVLLKDKQGNLYSEANPLNLDYLKVSHHGSICDLNEEFLKIICCNRFLISTDGTNYGHPDKKLIARIYNTFKKSKFYFNYENRKNEIVKEGGIIKDICEYKREF